MASTLTRQFANDSNYTKSDDTLIGASGGVATLSDLLPENATCWATLTSDENLNYGSGVLTGTLLNDSTITSSVLVVADNDEGLQFPVAGNFDTGEVGCIRFKFTPPATAPVSGGRILGIGTTNTANVIELTWSQGGDWTLFAKDSSNVTKINQTLFGNSLLTTTEHEIAFSFNFTTGATGLFIDGTQLGSAITTTFTRTTPAGQVTIGNWELASDAIFGEFSDIICYSTNEFTSSYTAGYTLPESRYSTENPWIQFNTSTRLSEIKSFTAGTAVETGSDLVKVTAIVDGVEYYTTEGALATSTGYSQSNTLTEAEANESLLVTDGSDFNYRIYLHSDNGLTTPTLASFTFAYDSTLPAISVTTVDVNFFLYRGSAAYSGKYLKYRPYQEGFLSTDGQWQAYTWKTFDSPVESTGHASEDFPINPSGTFWELKIDGDNIKFSLENETGTVDLFNDVPYEVL